jgi:hypothetical protein
MIDIVWLWAIFFPFLLFPGLLIGATIGKINLSAPLCTAAVVGSAATGAVALSAFLLGRGSSVIALIEWAPPLALATALGVWIIRRATAPAPAALEPSART